MSINMSDKEAWVLSRMAYMDFKDNKGGDATKKYINKSLTDIAKAFYVDPKSGKPLNNFGEWGALSNTEQNEMLGDIINGKYPHLSNLILIDYTPDQEKTNGLFAYAFKDGSNPEKRIFAFRGTEGSPLDKGWIRNSAGYLDNDWQDNLYTGTKRVSLQFDPAKAFVDKNMAGGAEIFVTGHSKGAGIASYIAATRPNVQGKSFDGPGIGQCLTKAEWATLENNVIYENIVDQYDRVGALAFHPEYRKFTEHLVTEKEQNENANQQGPKVPTTYNAHMMQSIKFDENGNAVEGTRSVTSVNVENRTKNTIIANDDQLVQPLGALNHIANMIGSGFKSAQKAGQNFNDDISNATNSNIDKTRKDIDSIIATGTQQIRQNIIKASGDVTVINNEIKKGIQDIQNKINTRLTQSGTSFKQDIGTIVNGYNKVLSGLGLTNDISKLVANLSIGQPLLLAIFGNQLDVKKIIDGCNDIANGQKSIANNGIDTFNQLFKALVSDIAARTPNIAENIKDLLGNSVEAKATLDKAVADMSGNIGAGLYNIADKLRSEFIEYSTKVANDRVKLASDLITIEAKSAQIRLTGCDLQAYYSRTNRRYNAQNSLDAKETAIPIPDNPITGPQLILGDLTPLDPDNPTYDSLGNVVVDPALPSPGREDILYDSQFNDYIDGKDGNDQILARQGGDDHLIGGEGRDCIISENLSGAASDKDMIEGGAGDDILMGGPDDDKVFGNVEGIMEVLLAAGETSPSINEQGDLATGGAGNDFVYGTMRNDALFGGEGTDLLSGGGGDDIISGDDTFHSAQLDWSWHMTDENKIVFTSINTAHSNSQNSDVIFAGTGNDLCYGDGGDDEIYGGEGNDELVGDSAITDLPIAYHGNDIIDGGDGDDTIYGCGGNDELYGETGDDVILGDASDIEVAKHGNDYVDGGEGSDRMWGGGGDDELFGDDGNDRIYGDTGDLLANIPGNDYVDGEAGDDYIDGEGGDDILIGGSGNDEIYGAFSNDDIYGEDGDDRLYGDAPDIPVTLHGDDCIDGGAGNDSMEGGGGDDTLFGDAGNDQIQGGTGFDYLDGEDGNDTLSGQEDDDTLFGGAGDDWLQGDDGDDYLDGEADADTLLGGAGDDVLFGGDGNDRLQADEGDDYLEGGLGDDMIQGGAGADEIYGDNSDNEAGGLGLTDGADTIVGGAGDDKIFGNGGNDYLQGDEGNDTIDGGAGDDKILGSAGNDKIYGGDGADQLHGDSNDIPLSSQGNDYIDGGVGDDVINGYAGDDTLLGGEGNDYILGDDTADGSTGNDYIDGGSGNDSLFGLAGNDEIQGGDGNDWIEGGAGNDVLLGEAGNDNIYGGSGDDNLAGGEGKDYLSGGGGNDTLSGAEGNDLLEGGDGNDTLLGDAGNDRLYGGRGDDYLDGGEGYDYLYGGTGNDTLVGGENYVIGGNDTLPSGGTQVLSGGEGNDTYHFIPGGMIGSVMVADNFSMNRESNTIVLDNTTDADVFTFTSRDGKFTFTKIAFPLGSFSLFNTYSNYGEFDTGGVVSNGKLFSFDEFFSGCLDENEKDYNDSGNAFTPPRRDPLILDLDGDGIETTGISSSTYFDHDGNGFAEKTGWVNNDDGLLVLDKNNDGMITDGNELFGDNAILESGRKASSGFEALADYDDNKDGVIDTNDAIYEQLRVWRDADGNAVSSADELLDLQSIGIKAIKLASQVVNSSDGKGNTITRSGSFVRSDDSENAIAEYRLATNLTHTRDNNPVDIPADIAGLPDLEGSGILPDLQQAMAKDDTGRLKDLVAGFVQAQDVASRNQLMKEILSLWAGAESVTPNSRGSFIDAEKLAVVEAYMGKPFVGVNGPNPNDAAALILERMYTRISEESYAQLMKQTHLKDLYAKVVTSWDEDLGKRIVDLSGVTSSIKETLAVDEEAGKMLLADFARTYRTSNSVNTSSYLNFREEFVGADPDLGWIFDSGGLTIRDSSVGTNGAEAIMTPLMGYISGGNGNDVIYGSSEGETIQNNSGDAVLVGGGGDDTLYAGPGADIIDGGEGNDLLYGGEGNDTYIFRKGSGQDTILDYDKTVNGGNSIYIGSFLSPDDIVVSRQSGDLLFKIKDTDDMVRVKDWFINEHNRVESVEFSNGTRWDGETIKKLTLCGTDGDDTLLGYETDDIISGMGGRDYLYGSQGSDVLDGGAGEDALYGEVGNDTYLFGQGSGNDFIVDRDTTDDNLDTILLKDGISPSDVTLQRTGNNLALTLNDTGEVLTVNNWFLDESREYQVECIRFGDGTEWGIDDISRMVLQGTSGNDYLLGYSTPDVINGLEGNDDIFGQEGDDVLDGGPGNDQLTGETGNDTYIFGRGYGEDVIWDNDQTPGNIDVVTLTDDVLPSDVTLKVGGEDLVLSINGTSDRLILSSWFSGPDYQVEEIQFADGTVWDKAHIMEIVTTPTESDDWLVGTPENDIIDGGGGNDTISGRDGADILYGSNGNDTLVGEGGGDLLYGGQGDDYLSDDQGENSLFGGAGVDTLSVSGGVNTLQGGAGNDNVSITGGTNTLVINRGDDFDMVTARLMNSVEPLDTVVFGEGITPEDLSIQLTSGEAGYGGDYGGEIPKLSAAASGGGDYGGSYDGRIQLAIGIGSDEGMLIEGIADNSGYGGDYGGYYGGDYGGTLGLSDLSIRRFVFADGKELTLEQILSMADDGIIGEQSGSSDNAFLLGSVASDTIYGGWGNERIDARDNDDYLDGGYGDDALSAGSGRDSVNGGEGSDVLAGGKGDDTLSGGAGNDVYVFNRDDGHDFIDNYPGATSGDTDVLSFGSNIVPTDVHAFIDENGNLVLSFGDSEDSITIPWFDASDDFVAIEGASIPRVQFIDEGGNSRIFDLGGIVASLKDSLLSSGESNPASLFTEATAGYELTGIEAAGGDYAVAYAETGDLFAVPTYISGSWEDETINGRAGDDTIAAGAGNDTVRGGAGDDSYIFNQGDGIDTIIDESTLSDPNSIVFGPGITPDDILLNHDIQEKQLILTVGTTGDSIRISNFIASDPYGPHAVEYFRFDDGSVLTWNQLIDKGFDIEGTDEGNTLSGTGTVDRITGKDGDDTIIAGRGDDLLNGGDGDDIYIFNKDDGVDVIDDIAIPGAGNTLVFGEGIALADISSRLTYRGNTLIIRVGTNGDEVHLSGFDPDAADTGTRAVQNFRFANGQIISYEELVGNTFIIQGDYGDDELKGTNLTDRLYGYEGSDILQAGAGNDTLTGGTGNDELVGGGGNDTYVFNLGDGIDTIVDTGTPEEGNTINFGEGIARDSIRTRIDGTTLTIEYGDSGDAIQLENYDFNALNGSHVVETLEFSDGSQVRLASLVDPATEGDDIIVGSYFDDSFNGRGGNDRITTGNGNDTLHGGAGDDHLQAEDGDDLLEGGSDNDTLEGGSGYDTYLFNLGDGKDTIIDAVEDGISNLITFGEGISRDDLTCLRDGDVLTIRYGNSGDEIRIEGYDPTGETGTRVFDVIQFADGSTSSFRELANSSPEEGEGVLDDLTANEDEAFTFQVPEDAFEDADGDTLTFNALTADSEPLPTWLTFDSETRTFSGTPGNGDVGSFTVTVSAADEFGATASRSFILNVANTNDAPVVAVPLADRAATEDQPFTFQVPQDTFTDMDVDDSLSYTATLENGDLLPSWLTFDSDTLTFSGTPGSESVGTMDISLTATDAAGASVADIFRLDITPVPGETIIGTEGNDTLNGTSDNDTLDGRGGRDNLNGGAGDDTLLFSADATAGFLDFAVNVGSPGVTGSYAIESIRGKKLSHDTYNGDEGYDLLRATDGDDALFLDSRSGAPRIAGIERIDAGAGNDVIDLTTTRFSYGDVVLDGGAGNDILWANAGNDVLFGGDGNDKLDGGAGHDILQGGTGNDSLQAGTGANLLDGGAGADSLFGGAGNEFFIGAGGDDTIRTGTGADIIAFNRGDGRDSVYTDGATRNNILSLGNGISCDDLKFSKNGSDLVLETGEGEAIVLKGWYASSRNRGVLTLQMIEEATADFDALGNDPLHDNKIEQFDFAQLVRKFDQARAANPSLTSWALTNALSQFHLGGSDTEALGGDLAYQYGMNGTLSGMGATAARDVVTGQGFAVSSQILKPASGLQEGMVRLG